MARSKSVEELLEECRRLREQSRTLRQAVDATIKQTRELLDASVVLLEYSVLIQNRPAS